MSDSQRSLLWIGGVIFIIVLVGGGVAWRARAGSVTGDTAAQRVASVVEIADRDGYGAADSLARAVQNDPDPAVRKAAIVCLTRYRRPEDRGIIETALEDDAPTVRRQAAKAMISMYDDNDAVERLGRMFAESEDEDTARIAAMALARSKRPAAVIPLVSAMDAPPSPTAAALALEALDKHYRIQLDFSNVNEETWPRYIEIIKHIDEVADAYEEAGLPLNRNMDIVQQMVAEHAEGCHGVGAGDKPLPKEPGETP